MDKAQIRRNAAQAVAKLAERAVERGTDKSAQGDDLIKSGWERSGADFCPPIKPAFLRQAVAYYDVAIEIDPAADLYYQQGLVLEQLSDFAAAVEAFEAAAAAESRYQMIVAQLVGRCRAKLHGTHDPGAALLKGMEGFAKRPHQEFPQRNRTPLNTMLSMMQEVVAMVAPATGPTFTNRPDSRSAATDAGEAAEMGRDPLRYLIEFAEQFVWLMVQQDFVAAHAFLSAEMAGVCQLAELEQTFNDLVADIGEIERVESVSLTDEPWERSENGAHEIYVSVLGDQCDEGIAVAITKSDEGLQISNLEWGRP